MKIGKINNKTLKKKLKNLWKKLKNLWKIFEKIEKKNWKIFEKKNSKIFERKAVKWKPRNSENPTQKCRSYFLEQTHARLGVKYEKLHISNISLSCSRQKKKYFVVWELNLGNSWLGVSIKNYQNFLGKSTF